MAFLDRTGRALFLSELVGGMALTLRVRNLLNDRYLVTYQNAQGNHYAPPRTIDLGLRLNSR